VATTKTLRKYLYYDNKYILINISNKIKFDVDSTSEMEEKETEGVRAIHNDFDWRESLISKAYKILNEESEEGRIHGAVSIRAAYKLIDGSYVMATPPIMCHNTMNSWFIKQELLRDDGLDYPHDSLGFKTTKYKLKISPSDYVNMVDSSKLISSIVFFFSKPLIKYDFEEMVKNEENEYINDYLGSTVPVITNFEEFDNSLIAESDDYEYLKCPTNWYKVHEIDFEEIMELSAPKTYDIDLEGFYQDYATRENMEVDQNTHHNLKAEKLFTYNSRLWIAGIQREITSPSIEFQNIGSTDASVDVCLKYKIETTSGAITTSKLFTGIKVDTGEFLGATTLNLYPSHLSYPDARAVSVTIFVKLNYWYKIETIPLKNSESHNYSYADRHLYSYTDLLMTEPTDVSFMRISCVLSNIVESNEVLDDNPTDILPGNTVMLSELNNPLIFPALHTYNVGEGVIKYFGVSSFPVSEGQFGQYPVFIFTSTGIYAANIGRGEVIVTSVIPISTDIATSCPITGHNVLFYTSQDGIMIIQGNKPAKISSPIEGNISPVPGSDIGGRFSRYSSETQVCTLGGILTNLSDFRGLYDDVVLAYDYLNKRLIASLPMQGYSYCLDIEENVWFRLSDYHFKYISDFPKLYGLRSDILTDISVRNYNTTTQCHFHTSPFNITTNHRKKIKESLLQCLLYEDGGMFAAVALFASNDGVHFTRVTGNDRKSGHINDIQLTYMAASYKYFVLAFWGNLDISKTNVIEAFNMQVEERYSHRLRSY
jgi:hypothetical protein